MLPGSLPLKRHPFLTLNKVSFHGKRCAFLFLDPPWNPGLKCCFGVAEQIPRPKFSGLKVATWASNHVTDAAAIYHGDTLRSTGGGSSWWA